MQAKLIMIPEQHPMLGAAVLSSIEVRIAALLTVLAVVIIVAVLGLEGRARRELNAMARAEAAMKSGHLDHIMRVSSSAFRTAVSERATMPGLGSPSTVRDARWMAQNLAVPCWRAGAAALWVMDAHGTVLYHASKRKDLPRPDVPVSASTLLNRTKPTGSADAFVRAGNEIVELRAVRVAPMRAGGGPPGTPALLAAVRIWDAEALSEIGALSNSTVTVHLNTPATIEADYCEPTEDAFVFLRPMRDINGNPVAHARFVQSQPALGVHAVSYRDDLVMMAPMAVVVYVAITAFLLSNVYRPLRTLSTAIKLSDVTGLQRLTKDRNEYGTLARALQESMAQKRDLQREVVIRERSERTLAAVSLAAAEFLQSADWDERMRNVLSALGRAIGADHALLYENFRRSSGELEATLRFGWSSEWDMEAATQNAAMGVVYPAVGLQRWIDVLARGDTLYGPLSAFPEDEHDGIQRFAGATSVAVVPIFVEARWWGFLCFTDSATGHRWDPAEVEALKVSATLFGEAISYKHAEQEIKRLYTEMRQSSDTLKRRTADLEAVNKELESFSYTVSHDLRWPLRAAAGYAKFLEEDYKDTLPESAIEHITKIRECTQQMDHLIQDLLGLARLTRRQLEMRDVEPAILVRDVLHNLECEYADRDVRIDVEDLAACHADPELLTMVYTNLISNAIKYTGKRDDAVIEIGCSPGAEENTYYVRDNGVGFDMKYAGKLFGVFQRLHSSTEFEGHGVGLANVQRIVNRHGGRVWAEAKPEQGATFFFTLQTAHESAEPTVTTPTIPS